MNSVNRGSVLPPLLCAHCGTCAVPTIGPGAGQHAARANCTNCGRYLKWLPRALVAARKELYMNVCCLAGRLARNPTVRFEGEHHTATFTLAVEERARDDRVYVVYVGCVAWGKVAESAGGLNAGDLVSVMGRLTWTKRQGKCGVEHSLLCVAVRDVSVLEQADAEVPA